MMGYIALNDASTLLLADGAQGVRLKLDDIFLAPLKLADDIVKDLPSNFYASNWTFTHGNFSAIQRKKPWSACLLFLIVLVAAFNIRVLTWSWWSTDKKSTLRFLRPLALLRTITRIFMVQGTILGVIGTVSWCHSRDYFCFKYSVCDWLAQYHIWFNLFDLH